VLWVSAIATGVSLGGLVGMVAERLKIGSLAQSVAAAILAAFVSAVATPIVWAMLPHRASAGLAAVSVDVFWALLLYPVAVAGLVALLHVILGRLATRHRAILLGSVGGLCGALPIATAISAITQLR
jgi:hypothetical protein